MSERKVEIYLNVTFGSAFFDYNDGDRTRCAWRGEIDLPEPDDAACHVVWAMFNMKPEDAETQADLEFAERTYHDRSLSVGDVVTLDERASFAVTSLGFKPIGKVLTGDAIVGPEGDAELQLSANDPDALERLNKGMGRMLDQLTEEVKDREGE